MQAKMVQLGFTSPPPHMQVNYAARSFGTLLGPNLVALFFPVARGSVILQAMGLSYPAAIRYAVMHITCVL